MLSTATPVAALVLAASSALGSSLTSRQSSQMVTPSQWAALNASIGGRLVPGIPFARSCFTDVGSGVMGSFDSSTCSNTVLPNYNNGVFRESVAGSYQYSQWETCLATSENCLLNSTGTQGILPNPGKVCNQGAIPQYFINISTADDVIKGFAFAKTHGLQPTIKNTGHDLFGRSTGPSQLSFWTHNLRGFTYEKNFVPQGCKSAPNLPNGAVRVSPGMTVRELNDFAGANNITTPGGGVGTVGVGGGYTMGGGHGPVSTLFGLAVDRAVQYEIVTPEGKHLFINECQNSDLFWAVNGGGGGSFGVTLNHWTKAFPQYTFQSAGYTINRDGDNERELLMFLADNANTFIDQGWASFIFIDENAMVFTNPFVTAQQATAQLANLTALVMRQGGSVAITSEPSYTEFWNTYVGPVNPPVGAPYNSASRLVRQSNFATPQSRAQLVNATLAAFEGHDQRFLFVISPIYFLKHFGPGSINSSTPAFRDSPWFVSIQDTWDVNTPKDQVLEIIDGISSSMQILRNVTPDSGTYYNEGDVHEPNSSTSYWGDENYARLLKIKSKYDPNHLLTCWQCVGYDPKASNFRCYI